MLIAITGGIGSGKSLVCRLLKAMGFTVYDCDANAKKLMLSDATLKNGLINLFGEEVYFPNGALNKEHLSKSIFGNSEILHKMNSLIHPAVAHDLLEAYNSDNNKLFFYESAILFESHFNIMAKPDFVISVSAPIELRISRASKRDNTSRGKIIDRINCQISQEEKDAMSDYVILNDEKHSIITQIEKILEHQLPKYFRCHSK